MEKAFKRATLLQKEALKKLNNAVIEYMKLIEVPKGSRHRKTVFVFVGDRYKPQSINCHIVTPKK